MIKKGDRKNSNNQLFTIRSNMFSVTNVNIEYSKGNLYDHSKRLHLDRSYREPCPKVYVNLEWHLNTYHVIYCVSYYLFH